MPFVSSNSNCDDKSVLAKIKDAYDRLTHEELALFLQIRSLPVSGSDEELAARLALYDLQTYRTPNELNGLPISSPQKLVSPVLAPHAPSTQRPRPQSRLPDLPPEILADILDMLGDWELCKAVGLPTSLPRPLEWARASPTDEAFLPGFVPLVRAADPVRHPPTRVGATLTVRFGYVHVLDALLHSYRAANFTSWFRGGIIPIIASQHGRMTVLSWWKHQVDNGTLPRPQGAFVAEAIEGACRTGAVSALDWWLASRIPLEYTEGALEAASAKNHVHVLEWWKRSGLPFKIGRVLDMASSAGHVDVLNWWLRSGLEPKYDRSAMRHASTHGKVDVLQWWLESGLQLIYDQDALTLASRHNRPEVLDWWDRSGLPVGYRICDIEEALEDGIGGGEAAREWWRKKGVNFNANDKEWMKLQMLN